MPIPEPSPAPSPALTDLAHALGVATEYWDWQGNRVIVRASTISAVLAALGVDTSDDAAVTSSTAAVADRAWRRSLPPIVVCRQNETRRVPLHLPEGDTAQVWVVLEDGGRREVRWVDNDAAPRLIDTGLIGEASFELPNDLPLGWHTVNAQVGHHMISVPLVISPAALVMPSTLHDRRGWGLMTQLYSVRSRQSWGLGDLADLGNLTAWAADLGADFVLVNPLHAAEPVAPMEASPYLPTSRRFSNPIYIRVEDIPEVAYLSAAQRQQVERHAQDARTLNDADTIDRDAVWAAKLSALRIIFGQPRSLRRARALAAFCEREGDGLLDFATWCALCEKHGLPWTTWPTELQDPRSPDVGAFRQEMRDGLHFHRWLQWIVDEQLATVQRQAQDGGGMALGIVHDLAVGVHPQGADAWGLADALARRVTVGAPPDQYNQHGQDWSQPPWRPDRLEELGYAPYRDMLRTVLRHAGGIRIDHVMGLFRLWWVPEGRPPGEGTYIRYDHEALIGILVLEAHRAGALVIGEDLGVVEPWVREYLKERGILGTSILWFERDEQGRPLPAEAYRELCLASVTTHDLPPTAGYLAGEHVDLRQRLGLLTRPVEQEREIDEAARDQVADMLVQRGLLRPGARSSEVIEALHRFLSWTPAKLVGVAVPDLTGDHRAINQPGTDDEYPNWRFPLAGADGAPVLLEDLTTSLWSRRLARCVARL